MIAFVLGGGGNRGALQVGALQVLLDAGIRPELLVGASAGAINAAFLAAHPTPSGAYQLGDLWQQVTKEDVYPGGPLWVIWHLLTHRDSLYFNDNFKAFLEAHVPPGGHFFALVTAHPEVTLHHLPLYTERPLAFDDFSQAAELIAEGREAAKAYLAAQGLPQAVSEKVPIPRWKRTFHQVGGGIEWLWPAWFYLGRESQGR